MPFVLWRIHNGEEYKLRLTTMAVVQIEKQLGMGMSDIIGHLMDATVLMTLLWGAMQQLNHGTSLKDVCIIYDRYLENGGTLESMTDVLLELLAQVGYGDRPQRKNVESQKATDDPFAV